MQMKEGHGNIAVELAKSRGSDALAGQNAAPSPSCPPGELCRAAQPPAAVGQGQSSRDLLSCTHSAERSVSVHVSVQAGVCLVCWCCLLSAPSSLFGFGDTGNGHSLLLAAAVHRCTCPSVLGPGLPGEVGND